MTNTESTDKLQHTLLEDKLQDKDDDKQKLIFLDLVTNIIQVLILFLHNLFRHLKIE